MFKFTYVTIIIKEKGGPLSRIMRGKDWEERKKREVENFLKVLKTMIKDKQKFSISNKILKKLVYILQHCHSIYLHFSVMLSSCNSINIQHALEK